MAQLPAKQRAALVMRYFLEMSEKEIAQTLHLPLSSAKWSLHDARQRFRRLFLHPSDPSDPVDTSRR